ncbi:MAG: hypothetical protein KJ614_01455 [Gammaproteobacteria bacterium]|uniref:hypothetical protein n=1 Tax=Rhodoferax sp. TaxID=50421 RepID=UPI001801CC15|nr:hypothetical protein [Rhodoferax sp.]MBU3897590.1 hypothetical protein [Gammaproteobacteria bacterium]MBA3059409.1 hypothetical protein [Rhodoferax sp.]MBU3997475.1 hypothetical protein [Gammaproteobacteria bacterium]MBU4017766.1 hypothetical protein [Gammaproteobacteria bacterium]MBU4081209.1 hypothetical protein [Gammaproteobacteria bacterium]
MINSKYAGFFPELDSDEADESTRPMPLQELPRQVQIDHEMEKIRARHPRIASAIEMFWGHKDCVEYLQQLILNGGDGVGRARVGFKLEIMEAFMHLINLHDKTEN